MSSLLVIPPGAAGGPHAPASELNALQSYLRPTADVSLGQQEFRLTARRPDLGDIPIDSLVESVEWRDEGGSEDTNSLPLLRGTLSLRRPARSQLGAQIQINDGHLIDCDVRWGGAWQPLWQMRVTTPQYGLGDGTWQFDLNDDLWQLAKSDDDFKFKKSKTRAHGYRYDEIVKAICDQWHVPAVSLVRGTRQINSFVKTNMTPLEAICDAILLERNWSGRILLVRWDFIPRFNKYGLVVFEQKRNPYMYLLKDQMTDVALTKTRRGDVASVVVARGHAKVNGRRKKLEVTVADQRALKEFGYIKRELSVAGTVDGLDDLRVRAQREMSKHLIARETIEVDHPGIAFIRRGDAANLEVPESDVLVHSSGIAFIKSAVHSLNAGDYSMHLVMGFRDPNDPKKIKKALAAGERARKRAAKKKKKAA